MAHDSLDCLVVGAGPAGLTAALYLARFRLRVLVADGGQSRAALIPNIRNLPGFPGGVTGVELLQRMRQQALSFGATLCSDAISSVTKIADGFFADIGASAYRTRTVLFATGIKSRRPPMNDQLHDEAVKRGALRYCPICDGFEVTDQNIAVIGTGRRSIEEALFLRSYTPFITLVAPGREHEFENEAQARLDAAGIATMNGPVEDFTLRGDRLSFRVADREYSFNSIYPAMGSDPASSLAVQLGADIAPGGAIIVDTHQRTSIPGVYAAGDVVLGLDQISHAIGEAGVAATAIRNDLNKRTPLMRLLASR